MKLLAGVVSWVLILVFWAGTGWSQVGQVTEQVGSGEINWSQGVITAKGSGAPPQEARNIAQARLMTLRAALTDARRNLLEVLRGVRVDSASLVENFILKDDRIQLQAEGLIQGSVELTQRRRYLSDGAIEVTVAVNLSGDFLSLLIHAAEPKREPGRAASPPVDSGPGKEPVAPAPAVSPPEEEPVPGEAPAPEPVKKTEVPVLPPVVTPPSPTPPGEGPKPEARPLPSPADLPSYTGVVIDARQLGMKPALLPRILDENGVELYRGNYVPQERIAQNGLALFSRDLTAAQTNPRVGKNPLTIRGGQVKPDSPADIFLRKEDSGRLAPFAQKGTFLEECKVMIVLD